ncbi:MAG: helix-turn-helix transcriptional regulator [Tannerellaceae bacterium]|nr:helix-turn-helix transcriptional regulator [Tannerellaceae bacterium]
MIFLFPGIVYTLTSADEQDLYFLFITDPSILYYRYISSFFPADPAGEKKIFYPLPIDKIVIRLIRQLDIYYLDDILDPELYAIKVAELFYLLNSLYTKDQLNSFFCSVLDPEHYFKSIVLVSYNEIKNIEELAVRCGLSVSSFNRKFHKVFNVAPYKWIIQQKIRHIQNSLQESKKPLKEIADEYGFSSFSQFNDYCKKHIGMTPGQIRKNELCRNL